MILPLHAFLFAIQVVFFVAATCHVTGCTRVKIRGEKRAAPRIIGGSTINKNSHPSLALLETKEKDETYMCGGTILGHYHVLTAAHCVYNSKAKDVTVYLGVHNQEAIFKSKAYAVREIIMHDAYESNDVFLINDIALLRLDKITFTTLIQPMSLPFSTERYKSAVVIGWGNTSNRGKASQKPKFAENYLLSEEDCLFSSWNPNMRNIPGIENMVICAVKNTGASCQGDSGGPLIAYDENDIPTVIGIVSFGDIERCDGSTPNIYTNVVYYLGWLMKHLKGDYCSTEVQPLEL